MPVNLQKAKEESERLASAQYDGSIDYLKLEKGANVIRILPPFGTKDTAWVTMKKSFGVGPNGKTVAPRFDATCPLKKEIDRLSSTGNEEDKNRASSMYPKNRTMLWVIPRAPHKQAGNGPILMDANINVFKDILAIFADPDYGDITDPVSGTDITINYTPKEETGSFPVWQVLPKRHASHLGTAEEIAEWTKEDLFEKYSIGKPSEDAFIEACIEGTEAKYLDDLKKSRGEGTSQAPVDKSTPAQQSAPPPAAPSTPPATPPVAKKLFIPDPAAKYWAADPATNAVGEMSAEQVGKHFESGTDLTLMTYDQSSGWTKASAIGFKMVDSGPPSAPAAPPAPAAPGPPPAPSFNSGDSDAALRAKIEAVRQAKATGATSQVAADVKAALGQ